jgi:hypothetical protein
VSKKYKLDEIINKIQSQKQSEKEKEEQEILEKEQRIKKQLEHWRYLDRIYESMDSSAGAGAGAGAGGRMFLKKPVNLQTFNFPAKLIKGLFGSSYFLGASTVKGLYIPEGDPYSLDPDASDTNIKSIEIEFFTDELETLESVDFYTNDYNINRGLGIQIFDQHNNDVVYFRVKTEDATLDVDIKPYLSYTNVNKLTLTWDNINSTYICNINNNTLIVNKYLIYDTLLYSGDLSNPLYTSSYSVVHSTTTDQFYILYSHIPTIQANTNNEGKYVKKLHIKNNLDEYIVKFDNVFLEIGEQTVGQIPEFISINNISYTIGEDPNIDDSSFVSVSIQPEYQAILDQWSSDNLTAPTNYVKEKQNKIIYDLKQAGVWEKLDLFYLFSSNGDINTIKTNWVNPGSYSSDISHVLFRGLNGGVTVGGNNGEIPTGYIPNRDATNFQLGDFNLGFIHSPFFNPVKINDEYLVADGNGDGYFISEILSPGVTSSIKRIEVEFYISSEVAGDTSTNRRIICGDENDDIYIAIGNVTSNASVSEVITFRSGNGDEYTTYNISEEDVNPVTVGTHSLILEWNGTDYDMIFDNIQYTTNKKDIDVNIQAEINSIRWYLHRRGGTLPMLAGDYIKTFKMWDSNDDVLLSFLNKKVPYDTRYSHEGFEVKAIYQTKYTNNLYYAYDSDSSNFSLIQITSEPRIQLVSLMSDKISSFVLDDFVHDYGAVNYYSVNQDYDIYRAGFNGTYSSDLTIGNLELVSLTSSSVTSINEKEVKINSGSNANLYDTYYAFWLGSSLTRQEELSIYNAISSYYQFMGVTVSNEQVGAIEYSYPLFGFTATGATLSSPLVAKITTLDTYNFDIHRIYAQVYEGEQKVFEINSSNKLEIDNNDMIKLTVDGNTITVDTKNQLSENSPLQDYEIYGIYDRTNGLADINIEYITDRYYINVNGYTFSNSATSSVISINNSKVDFSDSYNLEHAAYTINAELYDQTNTLILQYENPNRQLLFLETFTSSNNNNFIYETLPDREQDASFVPSNSVVELDTTSTVTVLNSGYNKFPGNGSYMTYSYGKDPVGLTTSILATQSQYQAFLDYLTNQSALALPTINIQRKQNELVKNLVDNNIWDKLDLFFLFNTNASPLAYVTNWISPGTYSLLGSGTSYFYDNLGFVNSNESGTFFFTEYDLFKQGDPENYTIGTFYKRNYGQANITELFNNQVGYTPDYINLYTHALKMMPNEIINELLINYGGSSVGDEQIDISTYSYDFSKVNHTSISLYNTVGETFFNGVTIATHSVPTTNASNILNSYTPGMHNGYPLIFMNIAIFPLYSSGSMCNIQCYYVGQRLTENEKQLLDSFVNNYLRDVGQSIA